MSDDCEEALCKCTPMRCYIGTGLGIFIVFLSLIIGSIGVVQFDQLAFKKPWGQSIQQDQVFTEGRYFTGFWVDFVTFPSTLVNLQLNDLEVFSSNEGDNAGTTLDIDIGIQYRLDPERLSDLFDIGGKEGYITQIEAEATEIVKNAAPSFNADFYLTNRREVEEEFRTQLRTRIAANFANTQVENVQLLRVPFPASFYQRKLDVGLQGLRNEIENFTRETVKVRDQTQREVLFIENNAKAIVETAAANASLIEAKADNDFERQLGEANERAMIDLAAELDVIDQKDFLSLNYLIQILNNQGKQKKFVNFGKLPEARSLL